MEVSNFKTKLFKKGLEIEHSFAVNLTNRKQNFRLQPNQKNTIHKIIPDDVKLVNIFISHVKDVLERMEIYNAYFIFFNKVNHFKAAI